MNNSHKYLLFSKLFVVIFTLQSISDVTTTQPVESKAVKQASELFLNNNNNSKDAGSSPHEQTTQVWNIVNEQQLCLINMLVICLLCLLLYIT